MKHILILLFFVCWFGSSSAQTADTTGRKIDARFVGSWSGFEKDKQVKGLTKYWAQHRTADGTFILLFTIIDKKGQVQNMAEKGKWWVKDGIFYELHFNTDQTDTYTFEVIDDEHIKFKMKSTDVAFADSNYEFIDTKLAELVE